MNVNWRSHSMPGETARFTSKRSRPARGDGLSADPIERRRHLRWPVFWQASLSDRDQTRSCMVLDFSPGGAKVRVGDLPSIGSVVSLGFVGAIGLFGRLAWQRGNLLGIEFRQDARQCAELMQDVLANRAKAC